MKVLVVAAMRSEMKAFMALHRPLSEEVATGILGIGTERARSSTERLVEQHGPEHVIVVGVAGGIGPTTAIGGLVVPEVVLDGATGTERRPAPIAGLTNHGTLHTSDELVVDPTAVAALVDRGVVALDMETSAVAEVCEEQDLPWSVMRGISDHADAELIDPAILGLMGPEGEPRFGAVARYMARHPSRLMQATRLARGLGAATSASSEAALIALEHLGARPRG